MWDLIVSVPDHCLSFYFDENINECLDIQEIVAIEQGFSIKGSYVTFDLPSPPVFLMRL